MYLGSRRKVWVFRSKDHSTGGCRSERLGTLAEIPTKTKALQLVSDSCRPSRAIDSVHLENPLRPD